MVLCIVCFVVNSASAGFPFFRKAKESATRKAEGVAQDSITTQAFSLQQNEFALSLLNRWCEAEKQNIALSPPTIWWLQAMAANGATGANQDRFTAPLGYDPQRQPEANDYCRSILGHYNSTPDICVGVSAWFAMSHRANKAFVKMAKDSFGAEVSTIDMTSPRAIEKMNAWGAQATRGKIQNVLKQLPPDSVAVLMSAAYLKALWDVPFRESVTEPKPFHGLLGAASVQMMSQSGTYPYQYTRTWEAVALPYKTKGLEMIIMLPSERSNVVKLTRELAGSKWDEIRSGFEDVHGDISIPRFKVDYRNERLSEDLSKMADGKALVLDNISNHSVPVDMYIHQAVVEVDEKGTEAAAITATGAICAAPVKPRMEFTFVADRPFVFLIVDHSTNLILFAGSYVQPEP